MPFLEWKDSLSTGIKMIDDQHRKLLGLINGLYDSVVNKDTDDFEADLNSFIQYSHFHFTSEEKLMRRFSYPGYLEHQVDHDIYRDELEILGQMLKENPAGLDEKVIRIINRWYCDHIELKDREIGMYFRRGSNLIDGYV